MKEIKITSTIFTLAFIALIISLFSSCSAKFKRNVLVSKRVKLTEENLDSLSGNYKFYFYQFQVVKDSLRYPTANNTNTLPNSINRTYVDSLDLAYCACSFPNMNNFSLKCFDNNDSCIVDQMIEGKLKSNGFFKLKNQHFKIDRIPFLFGGWDHSKTRIGLSEENELFVQSATDNWGAFLVLFGAGYSYNKVTYFKRFK